MKIARKFTHRIRVIMVSYGDGDFEKKENKIKDKIKILRLWKTDY